MPFSFIPPVLIILVLELAAFVQIVRRFKSPYVAMAVIIILFIVNLALYACAAVWTDGL